MTCHLLSIYFSAFTTLIQVNKESALPHVGGLNDFFTSLTPFSDSLGAHLHTLFLLLPPSLYKHSYAFLLGKN